MNLIPLFTLCFHTVGVHVGNALVARQSSISPGETESIVAKMQENPMDNVVQVNGCNKLSGILHQPEQKANCGPVLQALADAVVNNIDNRRIFMSCTGGIVSNIVFNYDETILVHKLSPNLTAALLQGLRKYSNEPDVLAHTLEHIAGLHSGASTFLYTHDIYQSGGFNILHDAVEKWPLRGDVQMSAWRGFSDHSHTRLGAAIIANWGGPLKGIEWLMEKLRAHPEPHFGVSPDTLDCHYEILQVVNGLEKQDTANVYGPAFMKAGLIELLTHAMQVDFDLRGTQEVSCNVLNSLLMRNPDLKPTLAEGPQAVVGIVTTAIQRFHEDDPTPWGAGTFGQAYPVIPECVRVLEQIASDTTGLQAIRKTNIKEILRSVRSDMQPRVQHLAMMLAE